ncbi:MAG: helix-turn-helix domain-containing protein [Colwellia sp.]|nr:helix-turn-helix domain-containing protein [Colwellia sp.]
MGRAVEFHIREQIIKDCQSGLSYLNISRKYSVTYSTVRILHQRFSNLGDKGLHPKYQVCGKILPNDRNLVFRASCWLKRLHPNWGAPFILVKLKDRYPEEKLPNPRTVQRWFKAKGLNVLRNKIPKPEGEWAKDVHETWQVDAKERIVLADGSKGCWLTIVDEKSGATLAALVFPPKPNFSSADFGSKTKA